ncbi:lytic murein transglycosylase [Mesorhizobium sp. B2-6-2]|nr:lytic murein transglycosylase [Mesorhizobium sp. B2-6-2]
MTAFLRPPLCPAGHLPLKGGDQLSSRPSPTFDVASEARPQKLPISPLEGEMSGRTERGAKELDISPFRMAL